MPESKSLTDLLSPEILRDILSRLPLKTRCACRCTCKTFLHLISSSKVTPIVAAHSKGTGKCTVQLRFLEPEFDLDSRSKAVDSLLDTVLCFPQFWSSNGIKYSYSCIVHSCNGLLNVHAWNSPDHEKSFDRWVASFVCNPFTNEYVMIPPDADVESLNRSTWLGFCCHSNRYKVLRISKSSKGYCDLQAKVLVVGSTSWMNIDSSAVSWFDCFCSDHCAVLDGVIYWFSGRRCGIVLFDFEREKFGVMLLPLELRVKWETHELIELSGVGVLEGSLYLNFANRFSRRVDIWIMKRDGNQEIWTKQFVIDFQGHNNVTLSKWIRPLQVMKNGEILLILDDGYLVLYNLSRRSLRFVQPAPWGGLDTAFLPSLVSLKTLVHDGDVVKHIIN